MSDGKEVKTTIHVHHQSGRAFVLASDHDRILAERDAELKKALEKVSLLEGLLWQKVDGDKLVVIPANVFSTLISYAQTGKDVEQVTARQARMIEKLRISMATALELESCGETSCPIPMRAMCSTPSHKELRKTLLEITAIEQGEGM